MKSKIDHQKSHQYHILCAFSSEQQWGHYYNIRMFNGTDKLEGFQMVWDGFGLEAIEHELDDDYLAKKDKIIENLTKGIDQDIRQLEFGTEWDGYDSYSLKILASGHIDTFLPEAMQGTLSYLQNLYDELFEVYEDELSNLVDEKRQMLNNLEANDKESDGKRLQTLEKIIGEIQGWFDRNTNKG